MDGYYYIPCFDPVCIVCVVWVYIKLLYYETEESSIVTPSEDGVGGPPSPLGFHMRRMIKRTKIKIINPIIMYIMVERASGVRLLPPKANAISAIPRKLTIIIAAPNVSLTTSAKTLTAAAVPLGTLLGIIIPPWLEVCFYLG